MSRDAVIKPQTNYTLEIPSKEYIDYKVAAVQQVSSLDTIVNDGIISKYFRWKAKGTKSVIFDASSGTSPIESIVTKDNPTNVWASGNPTLMGWDGISTYGVRVDSARKADSSSSADNAASLPNWGSYVGFAVNATYTAPAKGWINVKGASGYSGGFNITINGGGFTTYAHDHNPNTWTWTDRFPVNAGDTVLVAPFGSCSMSQLLFIYGR